MKCANCKLNNPIDAVNCLRCGEKLVLKCEKCGTVMQEDDIFCIKCGYCHDQEANALRLKPIIKKRRRKKLFIAIASVIVLGLIIGLGVGLFKPVHVCDRCGITYNGTAYYDGYDYNVTWCADCARKYFAPLLISNWAK